MNVYSPIVYTTGDKATPLVPSDQADTHYDTEFQEVRAKFYQSSKLWNETDWVLMGLSCQIERSSGQTAPNSSDYDTDEAYEKALAAYDEKHNLTPYRAANNAASADFSKYHAALHTTPAKTIGDVIGKLELWQEWKQYVDTDGKPLSEIDEFDDRIVVETLRDLRSMEDKLCPENDQKISSLVDQWFLLEEGANDTSKDEAAHEAEIVAQENIERELAAIPSSGARGLAQKVRWMGLERNQGAAEGCERHDLFLSIMADAERLSADR